MLLACAVRVHFHRRWFLHELSPLSSIRSYIASNQIDDTESHEIISGDGLAVTFASWQCSLLRDVPFGGGQVCVGGGEGGREEGRVQGGREDLI